MKRVDKADLELTAIVEPIRQAEGDEPSEERIAQYRFGVEIMEEHTHPGDDLVRSAAHCGDSAAGASRLATATRARGGIIGNMNASPVVGVVMGSKSDYEVLLPCLDLLREFAIPHEARIVSAHRTPDWLFQYAEQAEPRGLKIIIAAAGGAAHLPGMLAAKTIVPVLAVPVPSTCLQGIDSLLSIVQMPKGVPVATLAIGKPGAANAALLAVAILAGHDPELGSRLRSWRQARAQEVLDTELPF